MAKQTNDKRTEKAEVKKQNQDFPNLPASSERVKGEDEMKKEVRHTSKLHDEGKTDNTEKNQ